MSAKGLFSRALAAAPGRLHFAAHSHHLWPDAAYEGHMEAWEDAARLADLKWDRVFEAVIPEAQAHAAAELGLDRSDSVVFAPNTHDLLTRIVSAKPAGALRVVASDGEFHSFRRQAARYVESGRFALTLVAAAPEDSFPERFLAAARGADLAFVSHVMFKTGQALERLDALAALASPEGLWSIVDGYHAFMAIPIDLARVASRLFYLGGGYKYAMAGEGACFMHAPEGFGPRPELTGWFAEFGALEHSARGVGYGPGAGRFWGATFDPSGLYRFNAVRRMLAREGLDTKAVNAHIAPLRARLEGIISAGDAGPLGEAQIVNPQRQHGAPARFLALRDSRAGLWKSALLAQNVIVDARDDILRIGLGLYHDGADLDGFAKAARTL